MKHFGVTVREGKYGLNLKRENYAIINKKNSLMKNDKMKDAYADEYGNFYTDEWCHAYRELCLKNFDLNMQFFSSLSHEEFEREIIDFVKKNKNFKQVQDLNEYQGTSGYYLMILDKYCQLYIGTTDDIKRRIQQHWSKTKSFDRLLFPMYAVEKSVLSIDSFRALDTTRIFAYKTQNTYSKEDYYINSFSPKFLANRLVGGKLEDFLLIENQATNLIKTKNLITTESQ